METVLIFGCILMVILINIYAFAPFNAYSKIKENKIQEDFRSRLDLIITRKTILMLEALTMRGFFNRNKNPNDFLDFSGGTMGI